MFKLKLENLWGKCDSALGTKSIFKFKSILDVPRSKLVKYPLLLRQVVKFSSGTSSAEIQLLSLVIQKLESVLQRVDSSMAEAKCQFTISRVCFFVIILLILDLFTILVLKQQLDIDIL